MRLDGSDESSPVRTAQPRAASVSHDSNSDSESDDDDQVGVEIDEDALFDDEGDSELHERQRSRLVQRVRSDDVEDSQSNRLLTSKKSSARQTALPTRRFGQNDDDDLRMEEEEEEGNDDEVSHDDEEADWDDFDQLPNDSESEPEYEGALVTGPDAADEALPFFRSVRWLVANRKTEIDYAAQFRRRRRQGDAPALDDHDDTGGLDRAELDAMVASRRRALSVADKKREQTQQKRGRGRAKGASRSRQPRSEGTSTSRGESATNGRGSSSRASRARPSFDSRIAVGAPRPTFASSALTVWPKAPPPDER